MAEDDLTNGEIRRTLERLERDGKGTNDRVADVAAQMVPITLYKALQTSITEFKDAVRGDFEQVEKTSLERRDALRAADRELGKRIDGLVRRRTSRVANWIAVGGISITAIGLIATLLSHGGR